MSAPGFWEIVFLMVLALLIFGPDKLPGIARTAGQTITRFKREASSTLEELKRSAELDELRAAHDSVREELRSTSGQLQAARADLERGAGLRRAPASAGGRRPQARAPLAGAVAAAEALGEDTAPFDPDAT